ncbi:protein GRAVITROPIC IN THE LIGHT 1 [Carica papaya]|uniref:protein GRAVITROPIC IN THE LIGHT 1 n=1 Tax=Carica papaya TaxID=3649 RepID=UPI000B8CAA77|nr:protein GRAVITROPIC IN THE LIGHT 1 [Carica papaya]XP_021895053.1 protein GRAVITROPIC IN THE LIGHT 1 [Carica papaya]XP_021895055.1 protein GRAVITROPIC IN THE LIGHT 1 [Carica papaya]
MESVKPSAVTQSKSKLARTFAKVLHIRAVTKNGVKTQETVKYDTSFNKGVNLSQSFDKLDDEFERRVALEALLAKLFATVSSVKASYAQLQFAQSPYDPDKIQAADQSIVSELKALSELKRCFLKKQYDLSPKKTMLSAEIQEQRSLLKTYEVMGKKLESQLKLKDSELILLRGKLEECNKQNSFIEKRVNQSGSLFVLDNVHLSGLNPAHFLPVLRYTVKAIRSFVRLMIEEMKAAIWDIDAAVSSIEPGVSYYKADDKGFAFDFFVCRVMFEGFNLPNFSISNELPPEKRRQQELFFRRFNELKSMKVKEYLTMKPRSTFGKFCRTKYLELVHPKMETSFFGNLQQRSQVTSGEFPDTTFFASFSEMAKRIWLLHCLAFSYDPEASIFQVAKRCRFSEVYMESVTDEAFLSPSNSVGSEPRVAFTVVPGFRIGKTVIQSQVYLSQLHTRGKPLIIHQMQKK